MKTSVCVEMIFTEVPFVKRIEMAAKAGFEAIEFWNWDNKDMPGIKVAVQKVNIAIATFQLNRGGTLLNREDRSRFVAGIQESLAMAQEMGAKQLFLLTDELGEDRSVKYQFPHLSEEDKYDSVLEGLKTLAPLAEKAGVALVLEPLNTLVDHKGYWLNHSAVGLELVRKVGSPNIKLLFDCYHMQIMEGNLIETLIKNLDAIGHVHVADVPGRHEPGTGEINYGNVFKALKEAGYKGYIGFEFAPTISSQKAVARSLKLLGR